MNDITPRGCTVCGAGPVLPKSRPAAVQLASETGQGRGAKPTPDGGPGIARRKLSAAEIARVAVAFYWPQRHFGPNLRRLCREAIREARNA